MNKAHEPILPVESLLHLGPVVKIGHFRCPGDDPCFGRTAPLHNHLMVITRQPLWWRRAEGPFRFIEPGAVLLHRAGGEIERRACGDKGDDSHWFGIREDVFREALDRHGLDLDRLTGEAISQLGAPAFQLSVRQVLQRVTSGHCDALEVEESALHLLDAACAALAENQGQDRSTNRSRVVNSRRMRHARLADRARQCIQQWQLEGAWGAQGLQQLARELGVSVFHLCRVFKAETGMTLHAYRRRLRLGQAVECLHTPGQDLTRLAMNLGYSSHSHFSREFRQFTGLSPSRIAVRA